VIATAPPAIIWDHPGSAPYMGTFDQAVAAFSIPVPPRPMQCHYRDIWAGERFAAMMFGRDRVAYNVVADTDSWPAGDTRVAEDCWFIASGSEYHLVKPLICGNWALEVLPIAGWWPGGAPAGGWYGGAEYGEAGESEWSAVGYGWSGYGLPGGYGVPVSYEVPAAEISAPGEAAGGFAGIPGIGSSEYPSGAGGSGAGGRAVPEPPGILSLVLGVLLTIIIGSTRGLCGESRVKGMQAGSPCRVQPLSLPERVSGGQMLDVVTAPLQRPVAIPHGRGFRGRPLSLALGILAVLRLRRRA